MKINESELEYTQQGIRISCTPDFESNSILITCSAKDSIDFISIRNVDVYTFLNIFMRAFSINTALMEMYIRDMEKEHA